MQDGDGTFMPGVQEGPWRSWLSIVASDMRKKLPARPGAKFLPTSPL